MFKLALSAGHYMGTSGKRCLKSLDPHETREWWLNNRICDEIEKMLKEYDGISVLRLDDTTGVANIGLIERKNKANVWGANLYLAVHHNAGICGGAGGGVMAFVYTSPTSESLDWQKKLYDAIISATSLKGNRSAPLAKANLYEVREPNCPSVLLECGFMDSSTDVPVILTENFSDKVAAACVGVVVKKAHLVKKSGHNSNQNNLYRVAKSYVNGKYVGQIGAFSVLNNAKLLCDKNDGTYVFDENGNAIYPTHSKLVLNKVPLYATSQTTKVSAYKTGTYYLWDNQTVCGRRKITNDIKNIGVAGAVTGWIDIKFI